MVVQNGFIITTTRQTLNYLFQRPLADPQASLPADCGLPPWASLCPTAHDQNGLVQMKTLPCDLPAQTRTAAGDLPSQTRTDPGDLFQTRIDQIGHLADAANPGLDGEGHPAESALSRTPETPTRSPGLVPRTVACSGGRHGDCCSSHGCRAAGFGESLSAPHPCYAEKGKQKNTPIAGNLQKPICLAVRFPHLAMSQWIKVKF